MGYVFASRPPCDQADSAFTNMCHPILPNLQAKYCAAQIIGKCLFWKQLCIDIRIETFSVEKAVSRQNQPTLNAADACRLADSAFKL